MSVLNTYKFNLLVWIIRIELFSRGFSLIVVLISFFSMKNVMTAIVGICCNEGMVLASDNLFLARSGSYQSKKLEIISQGYQKNGGFSGLVVGISGHTSEFGHPTRELHLEGGDELAHLLLSQEVRENTSEELYEKASKAEYLAKSKRLHTCGRLKGLVEKTDNPFMRFNLTVMGFSTDRDPILVYVSERNITQIKDYTANGNGKELTEPVLSREYRLAMSLDETLSLACKAINVVLEIPEHFKGYQIAIIDQRGKELKVSTAWNESAERIDPNSLELKAILPALISPTLLF